MFRHTKLTKNDRQEQGQGLVEYALILVLVAVVVIFILNLLGPAIGNTFSNIMAHIGGAEVAASEPCVITDGGSDLTVPNTVLDGNDSGTWTRNGGNIRYSGSFVYQGGAWTNGWAVKSGNCTVS